MTALRARFDTVDVENVTRVFGATRALAGVTLTFRAGEVACLEGPNGAGKSTLLGMLATLAKPTSGELRWGDYRMPEDRASIRASIGWVAHESMVYPDLTPREALALLGSLHDLADAAARVEAAIARAGLQALADRPARTFSRGQLQRLAMARAELHAPSMLLFDEPTTGLDAASVARLEGDLAAARDRGCIVVLVTHDAGFAKAVSDVRIGLERGRVASVTRATAA